MDPHSKSCFEVGSSQKQKKKEKDSTSAPLKVVYVSSPTMVKTSVSEFKATVQHYTGMDPSFSTSAPSPSDTDDRSSSSNCKKVFEGREVAGELKQKKKEMVGGGLQGEKEKERKAEDDDCWYEEMLNFKLEEQIIPPLSFPDDLQVLPDFDESLGVQPEVRGEEMDVNVSVSL